MADPVGITGTALAVASLLYSTCRTICDIIRSYQGAPKEYQDLGQDLNALQSTLSSLQDSLRGTNDSSLSPEQQDSLKNLELPLKSCNTACDGFKEKLTKLTSHSSESHTAAWDRLRLHFNKSDVAFLRQKLDSAKSTIQVALGVSTLSDPPRKLDTYVRAKLTACRKTVTENQTALNTFQETTATTMSEFSGRVEALTLAIDSLSISGINITQKDVDLVKRTLDEHGQLLKQCLLFCTSALTAAHASIPGTQVKHAKALEHARQVIGNLGPVKGDAPSVVVDTAEAGGNAFQGIGNIDFTGITQDAFNFLAGK